MEFDLEDPHAWAAEGDEEEAVERHRHDYHAALFAAESDHVTCVKKLGVDLSLRHEAASLLLQVGCSCHMDPSLTYLATNYVDRFLSRQAIPVLTDGEETQQPHCSTLTPHPPPSVRPMVCLFFGLAGWKGLDSAAPSHLLPLPRLQDEEGEQSFVYDGGTVRRMELLVLRALDWRMRSITPLSFLRFFLGLFPRREVPLIAALKARASLIVFRAQNEMALLDRKPSVVAASALLLASRELSPLQFPSFRTAISSCLYVHNQEEMWDCCGAMAELTAATGCSDPPPELGASGCDTPVTVLRRHHRHCSSSESESTAGHSPDPAIKKRRVGVLLNLPAAEKSWK